MGSGGSRGDGGRGSGGAREQKSSTRISHMLLFFYTPLLRCSPCSHAPLLPLAQSTLAKVPQHLLNLQVVHLFLADFGAGVFF